MLAPAYRNGIALLKPNGEPADGKLLLSTLRSMPGKPTQAEKDAAELRRLLVEEIRQAARGHLLDLEEGIEEPHEDVVEAVIRALEDRYGAEFVKAALKKLRL